eukprot:scaffold134095_cov118-Phaeocystis_antarctica.AAC.1
MIMRDRECAECLRSVQEVRSRRSGACTGVGVSKTRHEQNASQARGRREEVVGEEPGDEVCTPSPHPNSNPSPHPNPTPST